MRCGVIIFAASEEEAVAKVAQVPEETAVAVFSAEKIAVPERVCFYRCREHRNPAAELAAVRAEFPLGDWQHLEPLEGLDVTNRRSRVMLADITEPAPLMTKRPLRLKSVACACGGAAAAEACLMVESLKHFHPEVSVYLLTDEDGESLISAHLAQMATPPEGVVVEVLEPDDQERITAAAAGTARPFADFWPITWVAAKLEALARALDLFKTEVMLCDADLIFTRRLPAVEFDADLVLSDHAGPLPDRLPDNAGLYNAGLLMVRNRSIVRRWRQMFHSGLGGFYEQGCLEQLAREYVTETFPQSWNWGDWRRTEDLGRSGRRPALLHVHLSPEAHRINNRTRARKSIEALAKSALEDIRAAAQHPEKIGFIHYGKAAGAAWAAMWGQSVCQRGGWQELNPFSWLDRRGDWTPSELALINRGIMSGMHGSRWFVHNHAQNWPEATVRRWVENGWQFAALYRDPRERLVSLYYWNLRARKIRGPAAAAESLEGFVRLFMTLPQYSPQIELHPANELIQNWAPANSEGMVSLIRKLTGLEVAALRVNTSKSKGFAGEVAAGNLSEEAADLINSDERVLAWHAFAESKGLT